LIENHIFGVDIQPIAVQISKLRFFISLIVEQRVDSERRNLGIRPLPNLETKFVAADTLIGLPTQLDVFANSNLIENLKKQLGRIREKHFFARTPVTKEKYRDEDAETRRQIRAILQQNIEDYCDALQVEMNNYLTPLNLNLMAKKALDEDIKKKKEEKAADAVIRPLQTKFKKLHDTIISLQVQIDKRKTLIAQKPEHEANADAVASWNPYDQNQAAKFFHLEWMFSMPHTEGVGFDVVIGNPPYIQIQKLGREKQEQFEKQRFQTYDRTGDIYELFYERGCGLLAPNGVLCYITSNTWMRAKYGASTRRFLSNRTNPLQIIDFGNVQIFESATVNTNILITQRAKSDRNAQACRVDKANWDEETSLAQYVAANSYPLSNLSENEWIVGEKDVFDIKGRVVEQGMVLRKPYWNIEINYGIKTGFNKAFIIQKYERDMLISADTNNVDIIKPILRGRNIQKFYPNLTEQNWLINAHNGVKAQDIDPIDVLNEYPTIYKYLKQYETELRKRLDKGDHWSNLRNCAYTLDFEKPKIMYPNMTKYMPFIYDENESFFINDKGFIMTGESLKYLTAIFNSKLFKYCFMDNFPELQGGTRELRKVFFEKIPIKRIEPEEQAPYERLVEYIIYLKQQTLNTAQERLIPIYFEQILDGLVYELYFTETFENANLSLHQHLLDLPVLDTIAVRDPSVYLAIKAVFDTLYEKNHPVRSAVFLMMSITEVKLIHDTVSHLDKNVVETEDEDGDD
jgi:adenine-specific DNA-methyltransferase